MKLLRAFIRSRYPWAILAGLILAASFPKIGIAGFAWIAPALILATAIGKPAGPAFRIGYVAGLSHYLASLYWLLLIPVAWAPILGWVALSAFLALFPASWVLLAWKLYPAQFESTHSFKSNVTSWAQSFASVPWASRMLWAVSCAALWVTGEMIISRVFGGFPWNLLGDSQYQMLPLIQMASFTGVYGVSFVVAWTSLCLIGAAMVIIRRPAMRSLWIAEMILPMLAVALLYGEGYRNLLLPETKGREVKIALVQPSIPQTMIWDPGGEYYRFEKLLALSQTALTNKPDLMIWPEAAVPGLIRAYKEISRPIEDLAQTNNVWMIIGADDYTPHPGARSLEDSDFYNSSFLVSPAGTLAAEYKKRNLVMFGEYVPFTKWLPFLKFLTPITGGFVPGESPVPFDMPGLNINVSVLICFEDVFPSLVREYVSEDTDFLVNLTNNGWFGEGAAQWQHAAAASFRAVENGLPLVRSSNNGLTCWIDSRGRLRQIFRSDSHGVYGPGFMIANVPVLGPGEKRVFTFYRRHGDLFGWCCVALAAFQLLRLGIFKRISRSAG